MSKNAAKHEKTHPCEAFLSLSESEILSLAARQFIGDAVAQSHAEVSQAFGVKPNTIKQSWAPTGMPGADKGYSLAAIAAWRRGYIKELERKQRPLQGLAEADLKRRGLEAEVEKAEEDAARKRRENQIAEGELLPRDPTISAWSMHIATLQARVLGVPDEIAPMLPEKTAAVLAERIRGKLSNALRAYSELTPRDLFGDDE